MHSEAMIAVRDVEASSAWYRNLLACSHDHEGPEFDRLMDGSRVLLMLHHLEATEHGMLPPQSAGGTAETKNGAGVLIWIYVSDVDAVHQRAQKLKAQIVVSPHTNPRAGWREFTVQDPDGYRIAIVETGE